MSSSVAGSDPETERDAALTLVTLAGSLTDVSDAVSGEGDRPYLDVVQLIYKIAHLIKLPCDNMGLVDLVQEILWGLSRTMVKQTGEIEYHTFPNGLRKARSYSLPTASSLGVGHLARIRIPT